MDSRIENLDRLCDPAACSTAEAVAIARAKARVDPLFAARLARAILDGGNPPESPKAMRLLEIIAEISNPVRVVLIAPLLHHPDPRVQSKASLLVARVNKDWRWV